ncbi:hypothetical protein HYV81_01310 [Candidatus Woesearchaeota archaeon]|nr:hypothetical protein [Candidatus Woesearchaeota archaeon]
MPDPRLTAYIQAQLQKGIPLQAVRDGLIKYGYQPQQVDEAFAALHQTVKHEHSISAGTLLSIAAVLLGIILVTFAFFYMNPFTQKQEQLLDINLEEIITEAKPGETITFLKEISNLGSDKRYDITVKHELLDTSGNLAYSKEETLAVETKSSTQTKLKLPATINASCQELTDACPASCDDENPCTADSCSPATGFQCAHELIAFCCGNNECEADETSATCATDCLASEPDISIFDRLEDIKSLAASNPDKASSLCAGIESNTYRDDCYGNVGKVSRDLRFCSLVKSDRTKDDCVSEIAKSSGSSSLCQQITLDTRRDACYMNFVLTGDYSVCESIVDNYLKDSCNALKQNAEFQAHSQAQPQAEQATEESQTPS